MRNKLLFNFGILLLEIGYGRPWHVLKQTAPRSQPTAAAVRGAEQQLSDYSVAEKLARVLIDQMGLAYHKIIRKCLGCDFGLCETDLDNENLQWRFQEDVVLGLKHLRQQIGGMNFTVAVMRRNCR